MAFPETSTAIPCVSVSCGSSPPMSPLVYDSSGASGQWQGECSAEGSFGSSFGINERSKPSYMRCSGIPVPVELSVVTFESTIAPQLTVSTAGNE